jgi:hypothetical protein
MGSDFRFRFNAIDASDRYGKISLYNRLGAPWMASGPNLTFVF